MNSSNNNTLILIDKMHSGQATAEEVLQIQKWKDSSDQNLSYYLELIKLLDLLSNLKDWKQFDKKKAWDRFQDKIGSKTISFRRIAYAAAAILLFVLAATLWNFNGDLPYSSSNFIAGNEDKFSILDDGSELYLQANSKIYLEGFGKKNRNLKTQGDFFVHVKKDKAHPFEIQTEQISIKVLGTSFKVEENDNATKVKVRDGKVLITSQDGLSYTLGQNEMFVLEDNNVRVGKVDRSEWGLFEKSYEDESLFNVINELAEEFGNLKIKSNAINTTCRLTTKIEESTIIEILEELSLIFDLDYTIKNGNIIVSNISC